MDIMAEINARLVGRWLVDVETIDGDWLIYFDRKVRLRVPYLWRILVDDKIALCSADHGAEFDSDKPLDTGQRFRELIRNKVVQRITVRDDAGDLAIVFSGRTMLEILQISRQASSWVLSDSSDLKVLVSGEGELGVEFPIRGLTQDMLPGSR
jgi:hypothetical protein